MKKRGQKALKNSKKLNKRFSGRSQVVLFPAINSLAYLIFPQIFVNSGATAKISSIHVNAWFGDYSKVEMTRIFAKVILDIDLDQKKDEFVFCGDSPNDESLFQYFPNSCGVANVKDFKSEMTHLPKYVSNSKGGTGFVEICKKFLDFD